MWIQRGGGGGDPDPLLSNTGPDLLKITKLTSQHSMLGHHRPARETPFKWWYLNPSSPHQTTKKKKKNVIKVGPPLTKLS